MNKRIITIIYATTVFLSVLGQENVIETESCISDETISKNITLPLVRNVYGGTKILVTYRGNWTYEMIVHLNTHAEYGRKLFLQRFQ